MNASVSNALNAPALPSRTGSSADTCQPWKRLSGFILGHHGLACIDQAVVSGSSFVALIMIGRASDANQLGMYAIAMSILAVMLATQESLVTRPYAIQLHKPLGTPAEHAFSALVLSLLLSAAGSVLLSAAALVLTAVNHSSAWASIAWVLAAAIPFVLAREFARRFAIAHLSLIPALAVDLAVTGLTLVLMGWLAWSRRLDAATALAALGASCAATTLAWLFLSRNEFKFRLGFVRATLHQSWSLGKWLFSGQLAMQSQGYTIHWLSMAIVGAGATGVYTACTTIVSFSNPLLFGLFNILTPKSVRAYRTEGGSGLRRQAARDSLLIGALMAAFALLLLFAGEDIMEVFFNGAEYKGYGSILAVLAIASASAAIGAPASIALAAAERARAVASVMALTAALNLILVTWLITRWGLLGAACGVLLAETAGTAGRWVALIMLVPATSEHLRDCGDDRSARPVDVD